MRVGFKLTEKARCEGKIEEGGLAYGQTAGMINSITPAGQIVHDVMAEAAEVLIARFERLGRTVRAEHASAGDWCERRGADGASSPPERGLFFALESTALI